MLSEQGPGALGGKQHSHHVEEVNQYRGDSKLKSYKRFEEQVAADPESFKNLLIKFKYPEPAGPKIVDAERVSTKFEATWVDANGKSMRRPFETCRQERGSGDSKRCWTLRCLSES